MSARQDGYILLARGCLDHPLLSRGEYDHRSAWIWLLQEAAWKDHKRFIGGRMVDLSRGQIFHSIRFLADAWAWDKNKVSRFLSSLQSSQMIVVETGTHGSLITISNYNEFQDPSSWERDTNGTPPGHQRYTAGTDEKEGKERKKEDTSLREDALRPANQISLPVEKAADAALFDEGRKVLGKSAGGVVTNLRRHFGDDEKVLDVLHMAATKSNPAEWVGAILRKPASEVTVIRRPIPKKEGSRVWGYMVKGKPCNPDFADIPSHKLDMDDPAQKREAFVRANDLDLL